MNAEFKPRRRIAVVTTRDIAAKAGRPAILSAVIATLSRSHDVRLFRLHNILELGARDIAHTFAGWMGSAVRGRPKPLQCALYSSSRECDRIVEEIRSGAFDAVYLDTVRCHALLRRLRRAWPGLHIVTDFDDLMSRRMTFLSRQGLPFLTGHTASSFPGWLRVPVESWLPHMITAYEAATLPSVEDDTIGMSNATTLLSDVERDMVAGRQTVERAASVFAIFPPMALRARPWSVQPQRFVFIGSDVLLQNRHAIAVLVDKWRGISPRIELHVYGHQTTLLPPTPNVIFHGFVDDLAEVYQPGSIAVVPALGTGGIKTKVAEAWAWGCPVLCNSIALEGFDVADYPLVLPETAWDHLIAEPADYVWLWRKGTEAGQAFIRRSMSQDAFDAAWDRMMGVEYLEPQRVLQFSRIAAAIARGGRL